MAEENENVNDGGGEGDGDGAGAGSDPNPNTPDNKPASLSVREIFAAEQAKAQAALDAEGDDGADDSAGDGDGDGSAGDDGAAGGDDPADAGDDPAKAGDGDGEGGDDPAKGDEPDPAAVEAATAKAELDKLLETYDDPAVLNAALAKAGVDKIAELPAVKEIIGRITQSVRDTTRAEIERAAREAARIADATKEGKEAKGKLLGIVKKAAEDLDSGDPEATIVLPTEEAVEKAFEDYAAAATNELAEKVSVVMSNTLYSLPEFGGELPEDYDGPPPPALNEAQQNLLNAVANSDPQTWLAAHLTVQRDVVWEWAQAQKNADADARHEASLTQVQAAHRKEIERLTKTHEKAIEDAKEEARAAAIADGAAGRLPPKTPKTKGETTGSDGKGIQVRKGAGIREIHAAAKAAQASGVEV